MANKNETLFSGVSIQVAAVESNVQPRNIPAGALTRRQQTLGQLSRGEVIEKQQMLVDPAICRMWSKHNRRYDLLSQGRCQHLIDELKAQGKQEFPAIVRKVNDGSGFQYEVICGARRHFSVSWLRANNYPQFKFLVEIRTLTDEEAFRLSDIENRDREDISDYERALDYKRALGEYYGESQKEMSKRVELSEVRLGQFLMLADLPDEIVEAYANVTDIKERQSRGLRPFLKETRTRQLMLKKAKEIAETQANLRDKKKDLISGQEVVRLLCAAVKPSKPAGKSALADFTSAAGKPLLKVQRQGKAGLLLDIKSNSGATKDEVIKACTDAITQFYA